MSALSKNTKKMEFQFVLNDFILCICAFLVCWYFLCQLLKFFLSMVLNSNWALGLSSFAASALVGFFAKFTSREGKVYSLVDISWIFTTFLIIVFLIKGFYS